MKAKKYKVLLVLLLVFISIYLLNNMTLHISDDFLYRFELDYGVADKDLKPVSGLLSLFRSQYHHYSLWNGRFVAHTIVQFFLQFDKIFFNVMNTIIYISLGLLILMIASRITHKKINVYALITVFVLIFLSIPNFGQSVLWISGASNYLWMSIIYLSFYYFNIKPKEDNWKTIFISLILGFLAGATNENSGPGTILMVISLAIFSFYKERKINVWRITGIISSLIGFSMILFAPAATKRISERNEVSLNLSSIIDNFTMITQYIIENYMFYFVAIAIFILLLIQKNKMTKSIMINIFIVFLGFIGATYSLAAVDKIIERTMFGPVIFLIIIIMSLLLLVFDLINNKNILRLSLIPLILVYIYVYSYAFSDIHQTYTVVSEQYEIIYNNPERDVHVPMIEKPLTDYNAYNNGTNYLKENKDAWLNRWAAKFFGVNSISGYQKNE